MASGKQQPSKQKRTNQNRQQRSALEARKAAASKASTGSTSSTAPRAGSTGGLLGRLRGAAAPRPATPRPAGPRPASPLGGMLANRSDQPVGYRAALTGLIAAVAAVGVSFILSTPVTQDGDPYTRERVVAEWADTALRAAQATDAAEPEAVVDEIEKGTDDPWMPNRDSERLALAAFPASLAMVLPVVAAYFAFRAVQQQRGSRVVNRAMYATLFGAVLTFGLLTFFLPTVIAVGVAGFQVRKAETTAAMAEAEIIEAEVVDEAADADDADTDTDDDAER